MQLIDKGMYLVNGTEWKEAVAEGEALALLGDNGAEDVKVLGLEEAARKNTMAYGILLPGTIF